MNNEVLQQALHALELVYNANTPVDQRKEADLVCQQLKETPQAAQYGLHLVTMEHPVVRHFGLQLLEHSIKHHKKQAAELRTPVLEMVLGCSQEPLFIREKLVALFVLLIIRLWPTEWPDLAPTMTHLYNTDMDVALRVWKTLGEEIFVFDRDAVAAVRKTELVNGLSGLLLPLESAVELYPEAHRDWTEGTRPSKKDILVDRANPDGWLKRWMSDSHKEASRAALVDTIMVYMDWVPIKAIPRARLVLGLTALLATDARVAAAAALEAISRRTAVLGDERDLVLQEFSNCMSAIAQSYRGTLNGDSEDLVLAKHIAQICTNLVAIQWARKLDANRLDHPEMLLELLMALAQDARFTVASVALTGWATIIKHPILACLPEVSRTFGALTEHATTLLFRVCQMHVEDTEEFDTVAELRAFLTSELRTRLLNIIRGMCTLDPAGFIGWIEPSLAPVLSTEGPATEAALMTVDAILSTLDECEQRALADNEALDVPCYYNLARLVVELTTTNAQLATRQLNTLPSLAFLLRASLMNTREAQELLVMVLDKCSRYLEFPHEHNVPRRATAALVRLAIAVPDSLMHVYGEIAQMVQRRLEDPNVLGSVKSHLVEFQLAVVANASVSLSERRELARPLIQPLVESLRAFAPMLQSLEAFVSLLGLPALDQSFVAHEQPDDGQLEQARRERNRLTHVLSTLHILLSRTLDGGLVLLWSEHARDLVELILLVVRCLHMLWNPRATADMPWRSVEAQNLFGLREISKAERLAILGIDHADTQGNAELRAAHHSLAVLREHSYKCLGHLLRLPTLRIPDISSTFTSAVFADVESMAVQHWRVLLNDVVRPIISPAHSDAEFVQPWLPHLFGFCTERLDREWHEQMVRGVVLRTQEDIKAVALGLVNVDVGASDTMDDIVREKLLRDWTRAWSQVVVGLLGSILAVVPEAAQIEHAMQSSARVDAKQPSAQQLLLSSPEMLSGALDATVHMLNYKDTQAMQRLLAVLVQLAPSLLLVSLMPMYQAPSQQQTSAVNAYLARVPDQARISPWLVQLAPGLITVLRDPHLVSLQPVVLGLLADLLHYSGAIERMAWAFRSSSGHNVVGDPGLALRHVLYGAVRPMVHNTEFEQAGEELARNGSLDSKRRRAMLKVALQSVLAVEKSQLFEDK
ncbi:armadillo-type protein [Coemansia spiralis]|nr:armadillo-type protein [Coemansia spiralis]